MTDDSSTSRSWRTPLLAGLITVVIIAAVSACGGDDDTAADPADAASSGTGSPSASPVASETPSPSTSSPTTAASPSGEPTPSPVINKAVQAALKAGFPALVPSGVPAGWSVTDAAFTAAGGGTWRVTLTDTTGAAVDLVQTKASVDDLVAQHLGMGAEATGKVDLRDFGTGMWAGYRAGTVSGIAKALSSTAALVYGTGRDSAIVFAQQLLTAEDADLPEAG